MLNCFSPIFDRNYTKNETSKTTWLDSYYVTYREDKFRREILNVEGQYMFPALVAFNILTGIGMADFVGQTAEEIAVICWMQIISVFVLAGFSADMTSALACIVRPQ